MLPSRLRTLAKNVGRFVRRGGRVNRPSALEDEVQFWRDWFETGGLQWPHDFRARFNPDQPLQDHIARYVDRLEAVRVHILDVGAGPMTKLGKKHPSRELVITPTDLLADEYDRLLAELGVVPLLRTIHADAERLEDQFGPNRYDIVHGQNCIDHTANPLRAIAQMVAVVKPQGFVVLYHSENEGQKEQYGQLHQWDFTTENGWFLIRDRRGRTTNITQELAGCCQVECSRDGEAIIAGIYKNGRM